MPTLCRQSIFRSKPIFRSPLRSVIVCVKGCVSIRPLMRTLFFQLVVAEYGHGGRGLCRGVELPLVVEESPQLAEGEPVLRVGEFLPALLFFATRLVMVPPRAGVDHDPVHVVLEDVPTRLCLCLAGCGRGRVAGCLFYSVGRVTGMPGRRLRTGAAARPPSGRWRAEPVCLWRLSLPAPRRRGLRAASPTPFRGGGCPACCRRAGRLSGRRRPVPRSFAAPWRSPRRTASRWRPSSGGCAAPMSPAC